MVSVWGQQHVAPLGHLNLQFAPGLLPDSYTLGVSWPFKGCLGGTLSRRGCRTGTAIYSPNGGMSVNTGQDLEYGPEVS